MEVGGRGGGDQTDCWLRSAARSLEQNSTYVHSLRDYRSYRKPITYARYSQSQHSHSGHVRTHSLTRQPSYSCVRAWTTVVTVQRPRGVIDKARGGLHRVTQTCIRLEDCRCMYLIGRRY